MYIRTKYKHTVRVIIVFYYVLRLARKKITHRMCSRTRYYIVQCFVRGTFIVFIIIVLIYYNKIMTRVLLSSHTRLCSVYKCTMRHTRCVIEKASSHHFQNYDDNTRIIHVCGVHKQICYA